MLAGIGTFYTKFITSGENYLERGLYRPLFMFDRSCYRLVSQNGGFPVKHSYTNTPSRYQSSIFVCPLLQIISGARYAVLPQKEWERLASLERPKSVKQACPC